VHRMRQEKIGCMVLEQAGRQIAVDFSDLAQGPFSGELTDGKGDVTFHEYTGISLRALLEQKGIDTTGISKVTVTSADNYAVEFTQAELLQEGKLYIAITADGANLPGIDPGTRGVQIIVFGDENSRRCVRFAHKITVE